MQSVILASVGKPINEWRSAMKSLCIAAVSLLWWIPPAYAETTADPSGHWEGTISAPFGEVRIEVDLARNAKGELAGAFGQPAQELEGRVIPKLKGLPLSNVAVKGRAVTLEIKATAEGGTFQGNLLPDGKDRKSTRL